MLAKVNNIYIYICDEEENICMQTLMKQSWKCILSNAAGTVGSFAVAAFTASVTASSAFGQVFE